MNARNARSSMFRFLSIGVLCATGATAAAQTTWYVDASAAAGGDGSAGAPFDSIQTALDAPAVVSGDAIEVAPGTYTEGVDPVGKDVRLYGAGGAAVTTIDVTGMFSLEHSAVRLHSGETAACVIEGFTLRGGTGTQAFDPILGPGWFLGGGLFVDDASPTVRDCVITGNNASMGGGVYVARGTPTLEDCVVEGNTATWFGAGLQVTSATLVLDGVTIRANATTAQRGGGLCALDATVEANGCLVEGNSSGGSDGANVAADYGATLRLVETTVRDGFTVDGDGGGLWIQGGTLDVVASTFADNGSGDGASNRQGGGIYARDASVSIVGSRFQGNTSGRGGALLLSGCTASVRACLFDGNTIESGLNYLFTDGGAIASLGSTLAIELCAFRDNRARLFGPFGGDAAARGGALWCDTASVVVQDSVFLRNQARYDGPGDPELSRTNAAAMGGALFGPARVLRSRFAGNTASSDAFHAWAEGGALHGGARVRFSRLLGNGVAGTGGGPTPDAGPAAEACSLRAVTVRGNLPSTLPPLGPHCTVVGPSGAETLGASPQVR